MLLIFLLRWAVVFLDLPLIKVLQHLKQQLHPSQCRHEDVCLRRATLINEILQQNLYMVSKLIDLIEPI